MSDDRWDKVNRAIYVVLTIAGITMIIAAAVIGAVALTK